MADLRILRETGDVTIVFDGDCAFCTSSARRLASWSDGSLVVVPWQRADLAALGLTADACEAAVQAVDGEAKGSGGAAIALALRHCRQPWRSLAPVLTALPGPTEVVYDWVSRNRHRLPGGTPACAQPRV